MHAMLSLANLSVCIVLCAAPAQAQWSTQALSSGRAELAAVTVGDYAIFAGGRNGQTLSADVDLYNKSTDTWTVATLSVARNNPAATVVGNYALFAGGATSMTAETATIDVFDAGTATWTTATLSQSRTLLAATTVGTKAIFAGGIFGGLATPTVSDVVDIYDASLGAPDDPLAWQTTNLSLARAGVSAGTAGTQALFAGGLSGVPAASDRVDIYDDATGMWTTATLSQARMVLPGASAAAGGRVYFGGGQVGPSGYSDVVDIYDGQTGLWSTDNLSLARGNLAATALGNLVIFAGGFTASGPVAVVDMLNIGTGKWDASMQLPGPRNTPAATTLAGRALIAGGFVGAGVASVAVEVYQPAGINFCAATINSSGEAATLTTAGSSSLAANDLVLRASCVPDQAFLFFHGATEQQTPFGNGFLCLSGNLVRLGPAGSASGGLAERAIDLSTAGIQSAGVRRFQCWFRDPSAGGARFNTSDAVAVTFTP